MRFILSLFTAVVLFTGCASYTYIAPSLEEIEAVKKISKTVALVDVENSVKDSPDDFTTVVENSFYEKFDNVFNFVERSKVKHLMRERGQIKYGEYSRIKELGSLLGAEFLIFVGVDSLSVDSDWDFSSFTTKKGKFVGNVRKKHTGRAGVSMRFVKVDTGEIYFSTSSTGRKTDYEIYKTYDDEKLYDKDVAKLLAAGIIKAALNDRKDASYSTRLDIVTDAVRSAVGSVTSKVRRSFPHKGEIINILPDGLVEVNLGSAYGIKPGARLAKYTEVRQRDPKTGIIINKKMDQVTLKVQDVTSGLSCMAKVHPDDIGKVRLGDVVMTD